MPELPGLLAHLLESSNSGLDVPARRGPALVVLHLSGRGKAAITAVTSPGRLHVQMGLLPLQVHPRPSERCATTQALIPDSCSDALVQLMRPGPHGIASSAETSTTKQLKVLLGINVRVSLRPMSVTHPLRPLGRGASKLTLRETVATQRASPVSFVLDLEPPQDGVSNGRGRRPLLRRMPGLVVIPPLACQEARSLGPKNHSTVQARLNESPIRLPEIHEEGLTALSPPNRF